MQIGHNRAGWYSHEWVERLFGIRYAEGRSATRIHPEFQNLRVGGKIPYSPFNAIPVVALEPEQYLSSATRSPGCCRIWATGGRG